MNASLKVEKIILVTGSNGQLGKELQKLSPEYPGYKFLFTGKEDLPVEDEALVEEYFQRQFIDYCINCAAYTAVDKAEAEEEKAFLTNAVAVDNLAKACTKHGAGLIHISTDYVFDGTSAMQYNEADATAPINIYGASKLKGEQLALSNNTSLIIIRTSWVYSSFGNNFVKTMLRLMNEKESLTVIDDQFGCPTYAADLARVILKIVDYQQTSKMDLSGVYNFCNAGITNWYEFALAIKNFTKSKCVINPIPSSQYQTAAKRPQYSVLNTSKIVDTFNITIPSWKDSLDKCLSLIT